MLIISVLKNVIVVYFQHLFKRSLTSVDIQNMKGEQIQTLHPQAGKKNKRISLDKYLTVKENIISILSETQLTHTELMERLYENINDIFEGGVQWYGETVKLDLEARGIVERTGSKPAKYRLLKDIQE